MDKLNINLYPHHTAEKKRIFLVIENYFPFVALGVAGLIALNIIIFVITVFLSSPYRRLTREWDQLSPKAAVIESLKKELSSLQGRRSRYVEMVNYKVDISRIFADVFAALPRSMWLSEIHFSQKAISIDGSAARWKEAPLASIDNFIKNLKQQEYFSRVFPYINLKSSRKMDLYDREIAKFAIECKNSK